jgi:hypothetical protein
MKIITIKAKSYYPCYFDWDGKPLKRLTGWKIKMVCFYFLGIGFWSKRHMINLQG